MVISEVAIRTKGPNNAKCPRKAFSSLWIMGSLFWGKIPRCIEPARKTQPHQWPDRGRVWSLHMGYTRYDGDRGTGRGNSTKFSLPPTQKHPDPCKDEDKSQWHQINQADQDNTLKSLVINCHWNPGPHSWQRPICWAYSGTLAAIMRDLYGISVF